MTLEEYEKERRSHFAALAQTIAAILKSAIDQRSDIRVQQVQHRAKSLTSLKSKLAKEDAVSSAAIEEFAKDLAGCRLIFYTNADVSRFLHSQIMTDNFEVDWDRTKIHHPDPQNKDSTSLFISNNYVVKLKDTRAALPEYSQFRDLWCEVQVQTTLNHAWSEMEHDIRYKRPPLKGFGGSLMKSIGERMDRIMREHLIPAGYEFQKVVNDFERLASGKELFDQDALKALSASQDNNARHDLLQRFATYVLPNYDDLQGVQSQVRAAVVAAVDEARKTAVRPIDTPFGELPGHTADDIFSIAADILNDLRYLNAEAVEATFDAICHLFPGADTDRQRKRLLELAQSLSKHELNVWKQAGPTVQHLLVERIRRMERASLETVKPTILTTLENVLRPDVGGTSSTYNSVTFHTGAVSASDLLKTTRSAAIAILTGLFEDAPNDAERLKLMPALSNATRTPHMGNYSNALLQTVLENTIDIVRFYTRVAAKQSYEVLQKLEHDFLWLYRRSNRMPSDAVADPGVAAAGKQLIEDILAFKDLVNANRGFVIYKTLVGYDSVFAPAWHDDDFDVKREEAYRTEKIRELVTEVTEENAAEWLAIIKRCASTESNDLATFPKFGAFLEELGRTKPNVMISYLDSLDPALAGFLPSMLIGLDDGPKEQEARAKVRQWVDTKQYLGQIIWYQRHASHPDANLLVDALRAAMETSDDGAISRAISASAARHADVPQDLIDTVFLPSIAYLSKKRIAGWPNAIWPRDGEKSIFRRLSAEQADVVLSHLTHQTEIDHRIESFLGEIAAKWPEKVIDFFGARLALERTANKGSRYDAVPFDFYSLHNTLAKIPNYVVARARDWFDDDKELFAYRGGGFISIVFPSLPGEVQTALKSLIQGGDKTNIEFVAKALENYKGDPNTHELYRLMIDKLPQDDRLLTTIAIGLDSTGVVSGEFGMVEAYKRKKTEIEPWLTDTRERVRHFAERHLRSLDRQIGAEQRRAEQDLEMRKRDYE